MKNVKKDAVVMNGFFAHIARCWRGEENLAIVFWFYGFLLGNLFVGAMIKMLYQSLASLSVYQDIQSQALALADQADMLPPERFFSALVLEGFNSVSVLFLLGAWVTYYVWHFVSVWRCANNASCPMFKWSARGFYVLVSVLYFGFTAWLITQLPNL